MLRDDEAERKAIPRKKVGMLKNKIFSLEAFVFGKIELLKQVLTKHGWKSILKNDVLKNEKI